MKTFALFGWLVLLPFRMLVFIIEILREAHKDMNWPLFIIIAIVVSAIIYGQTFTDHSVMQTILTFTATGLLNP